MLIAFLLIVPLKETGLGKGSNINFTGEAHFWFSWIK
jgi:hypothetical protein